MISHDIQNLSPRWTRHSPSFSLTFLQFLQLPRLGHLKGLTHENQPLLAAAWWECYGFGSSQVAEGPGILPAGAGFFSSRRGSHGSHGFWGGWGWEDFSGSLSLRWSHLGIVLSHAAGWYYCINSDIPQPNLDTWEEVMLIQSSEGGVAVRGMGLWSTLTVLSKFFSLQNWNWFRTLDIYDGFLQVMCYKAGPTLLKNPWAMSMSKSPLVLAGETPSTGADGQHHNKCLGYGYGSIPINTIFSGMNIHLPVILMFTRGTRFWPIPIWRFFGPDF